MYANDRTHARRMGLRIMLTLIAIGIFGVLTAIGQPAGGQPVDDADRVAQTIDQLARSVRSNPADHQALGRLLEIRAREDAARMVELRYLAQRLQAMQPGATHTGQTGNGPAVPLSNYTRSLNDWLLGQSLPDVNANNRAKTTCADCGDTNLVDCNEPKCPVRDGAIKCKSCDGSGMVKEKTPRDALALIRKCSACDGAGTVFSSVSCKRCYGRGIVPCLKHQPVAPVASLNGQRVDRAYQFARYLAEGGLDVSSPGAINKSPEHTPVQLPRPRQSSP